MKRANGRPSRVRTCAVAAGTVAPLIAAPLLGADSSAAEQLPPVPPPTTVPSVRIPTDSFGCTGYYGGTLYEPPQCISVTGDSDYVGDVFTYIPLWNGGFGGVNRSANLYGYFEEVITTDEPGQTKANTYVGPIMGPKYAGDGTTSWDLPFNSYFADGTDLCGASRWSSIGDPGMFNYTTLNQACETVIYAGTPGGK